MAAECRLLLNTGSLLVCALIVCECLVAHTLARFVHRRYYM